MGESFTTNVDCGGIKSGSEINSDDTLQDTVKKMVWSDEPPAPPTEYESISIGTWSSASDVDTFFSIHTAWNGWAGLKLGNYVTINDGTYNTDWEIAGFNCEHNQTAADGTVYNNGVGLCMIPKTQLPNMTWNNDNTLNGAYMSSTIHTSHLVTVADNLKKVLGNHLIQRNVLLSNAVSGSGASLNSSSYQWTTSYATLMSIGQMTGTFASNSNKYDDGEANYKLPVFNYEGTGSYMWSRGVCGDIDGTCRAWYVRSITNVLYANVATARGIRSLIYLR